MMKEWELGCGSKLRISQLDKAFLIRITDERQFGLGADIIVNRHENTLQAIKGMVAWMEKRMEEDA